MSSGTGITDADGHPVAVTVTAGGPTPPDSAGPAPAAAEGGSVPPSRIGIRLAPPTGELLWSCTPEAARELAAELLRAAEETENAPAGHPVTVEAGRLRRGDVRDGDRAMTVESARTDGSTVHVTWKSGAGRTWTQAYAADAAIALKRRLPEGR
ncbi:MULTISPECIES: hypothetical protein [unclassified Streptomyces]|uniref:hypothetical protein n=1 Tax=Streptomyces TaxID=1883 RepID=UPI00081EBD33|nr:MULTISPECIES: hypothetical protein [unclassified Streptomyces]UCA50719.1 hypothetical protein LEL86_16130 [Streptomyces sp. WA6-1-16]SCF61035.1 hypothetical protein GA0115280_103019 [Streptomyces sp. Cmuel-A718b]